LSRGKYAYFGEKSGRRQGQAKRRSGILRQQNKPGCLPELAVPHALDVGDSEKGWPEAIPCAQYLISDIQPAEGFLREADSFPCAVQYSAVSREESFNIFRQSMLKLYLK